MESAGAATVTSSVAPAPLAALVAVILAAPNAFAVALKVFCVSPAPNVAVAGTLKTPGAELLKEMVSPTAPMRWRV